MKKTETDPQGKRLIIGLGNPFFSDDGVGSVVAKCLKERIPPDVRIIEQNMDGIALMESWKDVDFVIVIDAVRSGSKPGTVLRLDPFKQPIPIEHFGQSSHTLGLAQAIKLAGLFDSLPSTLIVYGVEGKDFGAGMGLSPEVQQAVEEVVRLVLRDIQSDVRSP